MPQWLLSTSMLSEVAEDFSMEPCHAQMPSVRLKIAVVGTGGVCASDPAKGRASLSARRALAILSTRQAVVAFGLPANGLPSVITERTWSGISFASWRA